MKISGKFFQWLCLLSISVGPFLLLPNCSEEVIEEPEEEVIVKENKVSLYPPESIKGDFQTECDVSRSDNFDKDELNAEKWTFRTQGGARFLTEEEVNWRKGANIVFGQDDGSSDGKYISIKASANGSDLGSDGLSSKFSTKYGFYIAKVRGPGMETGIRPVHHPAIWGAWKNFSDLDYRTTSTTEPDNWLEIDFIELYDNAPAWKMVTIAQDRGPDGWVRGKQFAMSDNDLTKTAVEWQIIGLEFRESYIRFWRCIDEVWIQQPKTINIVEGGSNASVTNPDTPTAEIDKLNADRKLYWMISNVHFQPLSERDSDADVFFEIDHFIYYPLN